jgi:hypothetical protein
MHLVVVIPVYNERQTLPALVERVLAVPAPALPGGAGRCSRTVILVDDGSTDGSAELVRELGGREGFDAVVHERNRGKGAGLSTGFARALELGADLVIVQDADLEYDPTDYEAAAGARCWTGGPTWCSAPASWGHGAHRVLYYWHSVANRLADHAVSNMLTNLNLTDMETCLQGVPPAEALRAVTICARTAVRGRAGAGGEGVEAAPGEQPGRARAAVPGADLRGADQLLGPDLRGGEEDHLAGRGVGAAVHRAVQPLRMRLLTAEAAEFRRGETMITAGFGGGETCDASAGPDLVYICVPLWKWAFMSASANLCVLSGGKDQS